MKFLLRILLIVGLVVLILVAFMKFGLPHAVEPNSDIPVIAAAGERITRFLVLGCDRAAGLTDSMFVVSINETANEATVLQIPRDTYANYTDRDYKKINGALAVLGERGLKDTLSDALGVKIDHFVILDLDCLRRAVDAIGGVDVTVPQDLYYTDPEQGLVIDIPAGDQHLNGADAERFVRYRSGYADADLGRLDAQKFFLRAFARKCQTLTMPQMLRLTVSVLTDLRTDIDLPSAVRVVSALRRCNAEIFPMATLAGKALQGRSGAWYYSVNRAGVIQQINDYLWPDGEMEVSRFDPRAWFDRIDHPDFHNVYIAPAGACQ